VEVEAKGNLFLVSLFPQLSTRAGTWNIVVSYHHLSKSEHCIKVLLILSPSSYSSSYHHIHITSPILWMWMWMLPFLYKLNSSHNGIILHCKLRKYRQDFTPLFSTYWLESERARRESVWSESGWETGPFSFSIHFLSLCIALLKFSPSRRLTDQF